MNKATLIAKIADDAGITRAAAATAVQSLIEGVTTSLKKGQRNWWLVDAEGLTLGRLSTVVADRLAGKHKAQYTPFVETGDHVIVVNAQKVRLSGNKLADKMYRHHSGYPGGHKEIPAVRLLGKHPERLVEFAVKGMLPKSSLGRQMARKLKVYAGGGHPHAAQRPKPLPIPDAARG